MQMLFCILEIKIWNGIGTYRKRLQTALSFCSVVHSEASWHNWTVIFDVQKFRKQSISSDCWFPFLKSLERQWMSSESNLSTERKIFASSGITDNFSVFNFISMWSSTSFKKEVFDFFLKFQFSVGVLSSVRLCIHPKRASWCLQPPKAATHS